LINRFKAEQNLAGLLVKRHGRQMMLTTPGIASTPSFSGPYPACRRGVVLANAWREPQETMPMA
jgi:hypothetical protein